MFRQIVDTHLRRIPEIWQSPQLDRKLPGFHDCFPKQYNRNDNIPLNFRAAWSIFCYYGTTCDDFRNTPPLRFARRHSLTSRP